MAGKESEKSGIRKKVENAAIWFGEKSMYITVPLAVFAIASGAVAVGVAALALDGAEYWAIQKYKNRNENKLKEQIVFQAESKGQIIDLASYRKGREMLKAA